MDPSARHGRRRHTGRARVEPPAAIARCGPGMVTDRAASAARAFPKVRVALGEPTEFRQDAEWDRCADADRIRGDVLSILLAAGKAAVSTDPFGRVKDAAALQVCHPWAHGVRGHARIGGRHRPPSR